MKPSRELRVKFYKIGVFVKTCIERAMSEIPEEIEWPKNAYAFQFIEWHEIKIDGIFLRSKTEELFPIYYHPDCKIMSLSDIKREMPEEKNLIENMIANGWEKVIFTPFGNYPRSYDERDFVVLKKG